MLYMRQNSNLLRLATIVVVGALYGRDPHVRDFGRKRNKKSELQQPQIFKLATVRQKQWIVAKASAPFDVM